MYLTSIPQSCQGHHKQGKSEKLSQPRETIKISSTFFKNHTQKEKLGNKGKINHM